MSKNNAEDFEVIEPPVNLRSRVKVLRGNEARFDPVARAEDALKKLSASFGDWMSDETETLLKTWQEAKEKGFSEETMAPFFRASHDLKGQAATLGYPLAGKVAASLCELIEMSGPDNLPRDLAAQHVQAIRAMVRENVKQSDHRTASALIKTLREATDSYIESLEN
jgi:chemotaxis protein histidine kinase CheA